MLPDAHLPRRSRDARIALQMIVGGTSVSGYIISASKDVIAVRTVAGEPVLTQGTCYPCEHVGPAPKRSIVRACPVSSGTTVAVAPPELPQEVFEFWSPCPRKP